LSNQTPAGVDLDLSAAISEAGSLAGSGVSFSVCHCMNWTLKEPELVGQPQPPPFDVDAFGNKA
jgi:hypothetical protein